MLSSRCMVLVSFQEINVYGVAVPGNDGRAGMASIVPEGKSLDLDKLYRCVANLTSASCALGFLSQVALRTSCSFVKEQMPSYQQPLFIRIQHEIVRAQLLRFVLRIILLSFPGGHCHVQAPQGLNCSCLIMSERATIASLILQQTQVDMVKEGFDPRAIKDPLYFRDDSAQQPGGRSKGAYVPLTPALYEKLQACQIRV
jgi:hypothetical protein